MDNEKLRRYELRILEDTYEAKVFTPIFRIHTLACALRTFQLEALPDHAEVQEYIRAIGSMIDELHEQMYDIIGRPCDTEYPGRFVEGDGPDEKKSPDLMRDLLQRLFTVCYYIQPDKTVDDGTRTKAQAVEAIDGLFEVTSEIQEQMGIGGVDLWEEQRAERKK